VPTVSVQGSDVKVRVDDGRTILDGLYTAGYAYLVGCRRGGCAICKVDLVEGEVEYAETVAQTVLPDSERCAGTCLTCRAIPTGDVTIALRQGGIRRTNAFLASLYAAG
jgi:ferredoxin